MKELDVAPVEPFYTDVELATLKAHFAVQLTSGIYASFVDSMDNYYTGPANTDTPEARAARSEAPLRLNIDRGWFTDDEGNGYGHAYFLEKFNPMTGEDMLDEEGEVVICWVAFLNDEGEVIEKNDRFTDEQIAILFEQGKELVAAGLVEG